MSELPETKINPVFKAAIEYTTKFGWKAFPLGEKSKQPLGVDKNLSWELRQEMGLPDEFKAWKWKTDKITTPEEAKLYFHEKINIGVILGKESNGLVDLDFDVPEAAIIGNEIFPHLPVFGRASSPTGHRITLCADPGKTTQFCLSEEEAKLVGLKEDEKNMILEVRSTGGYTMFPPSLHPSGERVQWAQEFLFQIPGSDWEGLLKQAGLCAFLTVITLVYPEQAGQRSKICLALEGALLRAGLSTERVDELILFITKRKNDEEAEKRANADSTQKKLEAEEEVTGLPALCEMLNISALEGTLRKWLYGESKKLPRETIIQEPGKIPEIVNKAEAALIKAGAPIYQLGSALVRTSRVNIERWEKDKNESINRQIGSPILVPVTQPWLVEQMCKSATWAKPGKEGPVISDPQAKYAKHLLAREGEWKFPRLIGLICAPTLRGDGSILQTPGYDENSGLLYDPAGIEFQIIPDNPDREDALKGLSLIESLFADFPFVDDVSKAVPVATILTGLIRRSLTTAPMFCFDAPTAGTGKSLIADTVGIIVTGYKPPAMSQGKNPEEDEKRLSSILIAGDCVLLIDNCNTAVEGDFLCSMLTQETVQARILGRSERIRLPANILLMATGNNLTVAGDMTRRVILCRMDAGVENPEERQFDWHPCDVARIRRSELVAAGLTAIRAYIVAGRPCPLPKIGSFEDWNIIRETLVWLDRPDPAETRQLLRDNDPRKGEIAELLGLWHKVFGEKEITLNQIRTECEYASTDTDKGAFYSLLLNASRDKNLNNKKVGWVLSQHKDKIVSGLALRKRTKSDAVYWRVEMMVKEGESKEGLLF